MVIGWLIVSAGTKVTNFYKIPHAKMNIVPLPLDQVHPMVLNCRIFAHFCHR